MPWECRIGRLTLDNKITKIALAHPNATQDVEAVLQMMHSLFDALHDIYSKASKKQQEIDKVIEAQTIAIIGAKNHANIMQRMTPVQFRAHLQRRFDAIGQSPSWGEVAEIACDEILNTGNDPGGVIRREIKRALSGRL